MLAFINGPIIVIIMNVLKLHLELLSIKYSTKQIFINLGRLVNECIWVLQKQFCKKYEFIINM